MLLEVLSVRHFSTRFQPSGRCDLVLDAIVTVFQLVFNLLLRLLDFVIPVNLSDKNKKQASVVTPYFIDGVRVLSGVQPVFNLRDHLSTIPCQ